MWTSRLGAAQRQGPQWSECKLCHNTGQVAANMCSKPQPALRTPICASGVLFPIKHNGGWMTYGPFSGESLPYLPTVWGIAQQRVLSQVKLQSWTSG